MEYWHDLITDRSFALLKELKQNFDFVLIGGWAVFLYTHALKSRDIDLVVSFNELGKFKRSFPVTKNERLRKYEARREGIEVDIYVEHYSNPGLPAQILRELTTSKEGFVVPIPEVLLILKQKAYSERRDLVKGRKDQLDIFSLLHTGEIDFEKYRQILKQNKKGDYAAALRDLLKRTASLKELGLTSHKIAKLKRRILAQLK